MDVARTIPRVFALVGTVFLSACGFNSGGNQTNTTVQKPSAACSGSAIPDRFIVRWRDGHTTMEKAENSEALSRELLIPNQKEILLAEHDFIVKISDSVSSVNTLATPPPGEIDWGQQSISASSAWEIADGTGIVVAVVDSGADIKHAQLKNQLAVNLGEVPNNQIDDEKNGFVDDVTGFDFINNSADIVDGDSGHGTHVSGIIVGEHTGSGIKGIAPGAKLLPLRFISSESGSIGDALSAIDYAVNKRGAKIINASWGSEVCSESLKFTVQALEAKGVLFVAAAGNGDEQSGIGYNLDYRTTFPAAYPFSGQITVGAMVADGAMTGFSNFSRTLVHLLAPGWHIWSTFPGDLTHPTGTYARMDGTSMATPFVAGAAAVVWSYRPKATVAQVKAAILKSVNPGNYVVVSGGSLNLRKALDEIAKTVDP
jgi:subtilisin family serine protease